ncbi:MAG: hypothetical protein GMKNLPBB_03081 [Myxococcota bacterium]|nr:hypothetical protein [Myxococcota bacterium]
MSDHLDESSYTSGDARAGDRPTGGLDGLKKYYRHDLLSGFLVFLVALPLCLGISMASGFPPVAGVFTAIIGGVLTGLISNSELTIKGPAAGLIVIVLGAVTELGQGDPQRGYRLALGVGVAAGVIQVLFGLFRFGRFSEFFPLAAIHGMLASIGVIIASKQIHVMLGVKPEAKEPLGLLAEIPASVAKHNPEVALIGLVCLAILFILPNLGSPKFRRIPGPMVALVLAVLMGKYFDLEHEHFYSLVPPDYFRVGPDFLVNVPKSLFDAMVTPDFSGVFTPVGVKYIAMFALVGSLESMLSAKAIDLIDPWKRQTDFNRDLAAVGVGNTLAALIGGLPMISEIVRSSANIGNGAHTRWANVFHGLFLLGFVALVPGLIHMIPLAALAAMLVSVGYRLASPREFAATMRTGPEQLVVFTTTLLTTLATDLLIGIAAGIAMKLLVHLLFHRAPLDVMFRPQVVVQTLDEGKVRIHIKGAAVFSNWLGIRHVLMAHAETPYIEVELSQCRVVDHTVLSRLDDIRRDAGNSGRKLLITGLDNHQPVSSHPFAARKARDRRADFLSQGSPGEG